MLLIVGLYCRITIHVRLMLLDSLIATLSPVEMWLLLGVVLCALEVLTPGFILACFGVGAFVTVIPAWLGLDLLWQVLTFCLASLAALLLLRPFLRKLNRGREKPKTGVDALLGRSVIVRERIAGGLQAGLVAIDGDVWQARSESGEAIEAGSTVEIVRQESLILFVRRV